MRKHTHRHAAAIAVCVLASVTAPATTAVAQPGSDAAYRTGTGLLNKGLHDLAVAEFEKFLKDNPTHDKAATAHYALGVCYAQLGKSSDAARELDQVVGLKGFEFAADALLLRGQCALATGDEKNAASWFRRVVTEHPESKPAENATLLLGESLYRTNDAKAARDALSHFTQRWPKSESRPRAELFLALCEAGAGEYAPAATRLRDLRTSFPGGPYAAQATLIEAQCRQRTGENKDAMALYRVAADSNDASIVPDALLGLGQLARASGDRAAAAGALDQLLAKFAEHATVPAARIERARVHLEEKQPREAVRVLSAAKSLPEPWRDDYAFWTARAESDAGDHAGALKRLSAAVDAYPASPLIVEMRYDLAGELTLAGDEERAAAQYAALRQEHPKHPLAHEALGAIASIEYRRGAYAEAAAAGTQYLAEAGKDAANPGIELTLAECRYMLGAFADAEASYRAFAERHAADPRAAYARARRGMSLVKLDRFKDAEPLLSEAAASKDATLDAVLKQAALGALADGCFAQSRWSDAARWLTSLTASAAPAELDVPLLKLGLSLQRQKKTDEAIAVFRRLIEACAASPHVTQARFELGQALYEAGKLDDAKLAFEQVLASSAEQTVDEQRGGEMRLHSARYLATIATNQGRTADAAALYEQAASLAGDTGLAGELLLEQASASLSAGDYDKAERAFATFLESNPDHPRAAEARGLHGVALSRLNKHDEAMADLELALAKPSVLPAEVRESLTYERAWTLSALKRTDDAVVAYSDLLKAKPKTTIEGHARVELARLYVASERFQQALDTLPAPTDPKTPIDPAATPLLEQSTYLRGVCELRLEKFALAAQTLDRFTKQYPRSASFTSATLMLADAFMKSGQPQEATERLRRVVDASTSSETLGPALLRLGEATAAAQQWSASEEAFTRFLTKFGDDELAFQARFGIGWARENQGRHDAAIQAYTEVVNAHKGATAARAQFQIGECLFAMKKYADATRELLKTDILFAYPEWSSAALYEAGRCLLEAGKRDEAKKQFEEVAQRFPDTNWGRLGKERLREFAAAPLPGTNRPR